MDTQGCYNCLDVLQSFVVLSLYNQDPVQLIDFYFFLHLLPLTCIRKHLLVYRLHMCCSWRLVLLQRFSAACHHQIRQATVKALIEGFAHLHWAFLKPAYPLQNSAVNPHISCCPGVDIPVQQMLRAGWSQASDCIVAFPVKLACSLRETNIAHGGILAGVTLLQTWSTWLM